MPQFIRQTAMPCTLREIKEGQWVQQGDAPSGVRTLRGLASRVSVIGVVVTKSEDMSFSIDDGTGALSVRSFDAPPKPLAAGVGDLILLIARPREYNGERYLVLEICKRLKDPRWAQFRKRELELLPAAPEARELPRASEPVRAAPQEAIETVEVLETGAKNPFEAIIERIRALDGGKGADVQEVLAAVEHEDKERLLSTLIEEGEIFEIRPGMVKVLE